MAPALAMLEALPQPALLVDREGIVAGANRRARDLLGPGVAGRPLRELQAGDAAALDRYLGRCQGSTDGLVGALILKDPAARARCRGSRAALDGWEGVLLTLEPPRGDDRFAALTRKVAELDREVRERRHAEAVLAEALRDRDLLLRELQHRVKNNMHMLAALLQAAEREAKSPEAGAALRDAARRFAAVSVVQQMAYSHDLDSVDARDLIPAVARGAAALGASGADIAVAADPVAVPIDHAVPLALVVNELVANAAKHGRPADGPPLVRVSWTLGAGEAQLVVEDNGPGLAGAASDRRASGIGLVHGLLRQLGGALAIERAEGGGARCVVRLPLRAPRPRRAAS